MMVVMVRPVSMSRYTLPLGWTHPHNQPSLLATNCCYTSQQTRQYWRQPVSKLLCVCIRFTSWNFITIWTSPTIITCAHDSVATLLLIFKLCHHTMLCQILMDWVVGYTTEWVTIMHVTCCPQGVCNCLHFWDKCLFIMCSIRYNEWPFYSPVVWYTTKDIE